MPNAENPGSKELEILEQSEEYNYQNKYKVLRARLRYRRGDGRMSEPATRLCLERGNAVGVLLYDAGLDHVILVRQLRFPVYVSLASEERPAEAARKSRILEIVAGVQESGQSPTETARREVQEETGYDIEGDPQLIAEVYSSPGITSERITVFLAYVNSSQRSGAGGGLAAEGEDTEVVTFGRAEVLEMLARGEIRDAKTVLALQHLAAVHP